MSPIYKKLGGRKGTEIPKPRETGIFLKHLNINKNAGMSILGHKITMKNGEGGEATLLPLRYFHRQGDSRRGRRPLENLT